MFKLLLYICLISTALAAPPRKQELAGYHPGSRIIGGVDAKIENFPYMLSITYRGAHDCGGALISDTWVLTAAHCLYRPETITVQGNSSLLDDGPIVAPKTIIMHPSFDYPNVNYDIGLIELAEPFNCTYCKPIALGKVDPIAGKNVTLVGWGNVDPDYAEDGDYSQSPILQTVQVPVIERNVCNKDYEDLGQHVTDGMFCAGVPDVGGLGSCKGDSGGPVIQDGKVVGVVSWGYRCAQPSWPGVNTLVSSYLDWIQKTSGVSA